MKIIVAGAIVLLSSSVNAQTSRLTIDVDPRVELFSIVQFIGGRMNNHLDTRYAREVHAYFDAYQDHSAVRLIRALVADDRAWGIPATIGVVLDSLPELRLRAALPAQIAPHPISADSMRLYIEAVRDFAKVSDFQRFFREHEPFYAQIARDTRTRMGTTDYLGAVEQFWGGRQALYAIHLSALMPSGGVGPRVPRADGSIEVHSILGAISAPDSIPAFGNAGYLRNLILHEFSHTFVNPLTARNDSAVAKWEVLMWPVRNRLRQADGLTSWSSAVNEFVIRAFTANMTARLDGESAANNFVLSQRQLGFIYLPRFREWLAEYETDRKRWPTFADYYPTLMKHFGELASSHLVADSTESAYAGDFAMARWANEEFVYVFVIPTMERSPEMQDSLHALVRQIRDLRFPESMIVQDVDALNQDLSRFSVWAWGTPDGNLWIRKYRDQLPIGIFGDSVVAGDSTFRSKSLVAIMALRNPQNRRYPLLVSTGQRIEEVSRAFWIWDADYVVMDGSHVRASGNWPRKTDALWGFGDKAPSPRP